jgi:hypothetical protein
MSSQDDKETILLGIKSLEKAIDRLVQRRRASVDQRTQIQIQTLVHHIRHFLTQVFEKRQSLCALLTWFRKEWDRIEPELPNHPVAVLQHALQLFVRCQDGLVLLTSGECRHPGDLQQSKAQTKYKSRLQTLKERGDGYTCLYKADAVYSGFGWDEYANETVGIQARLVGSLKRTLHKAPWDYLERQGATQLLETLLDQQELGVKTLQHELQAMKRRMLDGISQRLHPTKLSFVTQDKMERLSLAYEQQTIRLERRADNFQIQQGSGVLPNEYTIPKDWERYSLHLSSNEGKSTSSDGSSKVNKKRRLVIEDSDSEQEEGKRKAHKTTAENAKPIEKQSSGLMVRVVTSKPKAETEDSLTAIKTQMGVDVQGLETSREELEQETSQEGAAYNYEEDKVARLKKVLRRAQSRQYVDENEVWDARECLRQACMELGNDYLWSSNKNLEKALDSFQEAKTLVQEQQASHQRVIENSNDTNTEESRYIQRNLIFLLGQATVNIGIVLVELSQTERTIRKKQASQSLIEFQQVRRLAEEMREQARSARLQYRVHSMEWVDTTADILKADQLESLACRWMGLSLWSCSKEKQAIEVLEQASSLFSESAGGRKTFRGRLLHDMLEVAAECIFATCTLADLACSAMERLNRSARHKGDELLSVVTQALERHAKISQEIEHLAIDDNSIADEVQMFQRENEISASMDILQDLDQIKEWWENVKKQPTGFGSNNRNSIPRLSAKFPRSDLFPDGSPNGHAEPTAHIIIVSEGSRRRKKKHNQAAVNALSSSESYDAVRALKDADSKRTRRRTEFRKWGDDLFPQEVVDIEAPAVTRPKLQYPFTAPAIPADMKLVLNT